MAGRPGKDYQDVLKAHISRLLIMDGSATNIEIVRALNKIGIRIGSDHVAKLRRKIATEKLHRDTHWTIEVFLKNYLDAIKLSDRLLWKIASDHSEKGPVKIMALANIRENGKAVFDKLFEAGIFRKQLGELNLNSFADIVKYAQARVAQSEHNGRIPESGRAMEIQPGGSAPGSVGAAAHLVETTRDTAVSGEAQADSS